MAWAELFKNTDFSFGWAAQSDVNSGGSSFYFLDCEMPQVSYEAAQTDTKRARRALGAGTRRLTGKVWPRLSVKMPAFGQAAAYAYASDTPALAGPNGLLNFFGGQSVVAYQASGINSTDANTMSLLTSQGKLGCLIAGREASGVVQAMGFAKTIGSGGPYNTDLFEDMRALPTNGIARIPSLTCFPGSTAPSPLTLRGCGAHTSMERRYLGCYLKKATLRFDEDWRPYWLTEFISYGGELPRAELPGSGGGLKAITEHQLLEPLLNRGGARFVLGSNVFTTFNNASVDADGTCDIRNLELSIEWEHYPVICPTGRQGVKEVVIGSPTITATFTVPDISDFESSGEQFQEAAWRNGTDVSLSCYIGDTPGQILAWNIPRGMPTIFPDPEWVDNAWHRKISLEAGDYTGDTSAADAGNKPLRIAWA